jgi:hypothetical protein
MGDMKLRSSRHCRHRRLRYRRHRRSVSIVEKKEDRCKRRNVSHGKQKINKKLRGRRVTVHSSSYRLRVVRGAMLMSMEEMVNKKQIKGATKKVTFVARGNPNRRLNNWLAEIFL